MHARNKNVQAEIGRRNTKGSNNARKRFVLKTDKHKTFSAFREKFSGNGP